MSLVDQASSRAARKAAIKPSNVECGPVAASGRHVSPSWRLLVLLCLQGGGEDLEAAGVGDVDAAASGGFCVGTGERNNLGYT